MRTPDETNSIAGETPALLSTPERTGNASWPSADLVKQDLTAASYTPAQISDVLWLYEQCKTKGLRTYADLVAMINWDGDVSVISRIMRGKYTGSLDKFFAKIRGFRQTLTARQDFGEEPIVETSVVTDTAKLCDLARVSATMALLHGPNQSGKSVGTDLYRQRNNHGRTILVRMPVGGGTRMFALALAKACGISERNCYDQLRDRILSFFDSTMLLIVDEVHQAFIGRSLKVVTIEFIREIHDVAKCGVVLVGTDVLPEMMADPRFKRFLGQIANRGVLRRRIPSTPPARDVQLICKAYGLDKPEGDSARLVKEISAESGIGKLTKYLRMARRLANNKQEPLEWGHFLTTHATLSAWAAGEGN